MKISYTENIPDARYISVKNVSSLHVSLSLSLSLFLSLAF